jgi:hypothetical protein
MRAKIGILTVLSVLCAARGAYAQGCALCYTTASQIGSSAQRSLNWGIFALMIPALVLFLGVFFLLFRRAASVSA